MNGFFKGSAEADTMLKKKVTVRSAGLKTERKFFGPRGVFAKAGHTGHLKAYKNPSLSKEGQWHKIVSNLIREGFLSRSLNSFTREVSGLRQTIRLEPKVWRVLYCNPNLAALRTVSLGTYEVLEDAIIAANLQANDFLAVYKPHKKNQNRETHFRVSKPGGRWAYFDRLEDAKAYAQQILDKTGNFATVEHVAKKNPITVVGNPPNRINTTVAGVLYNRCREIRAEKTEAGKLNGLYYHPFLERSKVCVLALDNGDILIHSRAGEKLWKLD